MTFTVIFRFLFSFLLQSYLLTIHQHNVDIWLRTIILCKQEILAIFTCIQPFHSSVWSLFKSLSFVVFMLNTNATNTRRKNRNTNMSLEYCFSTLGLKTKQEKYYTWFIEIKYKLWLHLRYFYCRVIIIITVHLSLI